MGTTLRNCGENEDQENDASRPADDPSAFGREDAGREEGEPQGPREAGRVWGPWATIGFSLLIILGGLAVQIVIVVVYTIAEVMKETDLESIVTNIEADKDFTWTCVMIMDIVVVLLILAAIKIRKGAPVRDYLSLKKVPLKGAIFWSVVTLLYCFMTDALLPKIGIDTGGEWALEEWTLTQNKILLILAINIFAPVVEEFFFRGFMMKGLLHSRGGVLLALLVPSFLWSIVHIQYDLGYIAVIFVGGILFGLARYRTKTLFTPMIMHFIWNAYATLRIAIEAG
ncbi:MAG: lysostaphin resistance A-like protein [Planctomycetota bacterium]|jgi:membrane protease YdiL (CAAX protease family)